MIIRTCRHTDLLALDIEIFRQTGRQAAFGEVLLYAVGQAVGQLDGDWPAINGWWCADVSESTFVATTVAMSCC